MFTGIVETTGKVEARRDTADGATFELSVGSLAERLSPGDSLAVNGVCLTVEKLDGQRVTVTAVGETLKLTTLGDADAGSAVNLETAATLQTALGGHLVQGHVDGVARVESFEREGEDHLLTLQLDDELHQYAVHKGSITVDGVSLTIIDPRPDRTIRITIVPHTLERTIVKNYAAGTRVNVEADVIGKYVMHFLTRANN